MVDRVEYANHFMSSVLNAIEASQAYIWTALPGIIYSYNATAMTAEIIPAIKAKILQQDGSFIDKAIPLLQDCPVLFPGGGGWEFTFPLAQGDEVLVIFAKNCIDAWWQGGAGSDGMTAQPQLEMRTHDLSDGFCIPKVWSQKKKISNVSTTTAQWRSDDGTQLIELAASGVVNIKAPGNLNVTGAIDVTGSVNINSSQPIKRILSTTHLTTFIPTFSAFGAQSTTYTVTGAKPGDTVIVNPGSIQNGLFTMQAYVSSNDTVTLTIQNTNINPEPWGNSTFTFTVLGFT